MPMRQLLKSETEIPIPYLHLYHHHYFRILVGMRSSCFYKSNVCHWDSGYWSTWAFPIWLMRMDSLYLR